MPAVVSSTDGSYEGGTSDAEGTRRWPRSSKKDRKSSRISAAVMASEFMRRGGGTPMRPVAKPRVGFSANPDGARHNACSLYGALSTKHVHFPRRRSRGPSCQD